MAKRMHEGQTRIWVTDKAKWMLKKLCNRYLRKECTQASIAIEEAYQAVRAKDKADRDRKRKAKR